MDFYFVKLIQGTTNSFCKTGQIYENQSKSAIPTAECIGIQCITLYNTNNTKKDTHLFHATFTPTCSLYYGFNGV